MDYKGEIPLAPVPDPLEVDEVKADTINAETVNATTVNAGRLDADQIGVATAYDLPIVGGAVGQVLTTIGPGLTAWEDHTQFAKGDLMYVNDTTRLVVANPVGTGTTSSQVPLTPGIGSLTIPANTISKGDVYVLRLFGDYSVPSSPPDKYLLVEFTLNGTVVAAADGADLIRSIVPATPITSDKAWWTEIKLTFKGQPTEAINAVVSGHTNWADWEANRTVTRRFEGGENITVDGSLSNTVGIRVLVEDDGPNQQFSVVTRHLTLQKQYAGLAIPTQDQVCSTFSDVTFNSVTTPWIGDTVEVDNIAGAYESIGGYYKQRHRSNDNAGGILLQHKRSRGTLEAKTALLANDIMTVDYFAGNDGSNDSNGVSRTTYVDENWVPGSHGAGMKFNTVDIGTVTLTTKLRLDTDGVSIYDEYTLPTTDGTVGQVLTTDGVGITSWATRPQPYVGGFGGYLNTTNTTFALVNQWVNVVNDQTIPGTMDGFTLTGTASQPSLTYNGDDGRYVRLYASWSWEKGGGPGSAEYAVGMFRNGNLIPYTWMSSVLDDTLNYPRSASTGFTVTANGGDLFELRVRNNTDADPILFADVNFSGFTI